MEVSKLLHSPENEQVLSSLRHFRTILLDVSINSTCLHPHSCERKQRLAVVWLQLKAERVNRCTNFSPVQCEVRPAPPSLPSFEKEGLCSLAAS